MDGVAGVKLISLVAAVLQAGAMLARLFAVWAEAETQTWSIVVVYIAQFVVGAVGPLVMSAPPLLSAYVTLTLTRTLPLPQTPNPNPNPNPADGSPTVAKRVRWPMCMW